MLIGAALFPLPSFAQPPQLEHPADKYISDQPLGAFLGTDSTTFRVFAPTASAVEVRLYEFPTGGKPRALKMKRNGDGTWEVTAPERLEGRYYTLLARGQDVGFGHEVIDPYARCVTAYDGRGFLVEDKTPLAPRPTFPPSEAVIYELSVRDFTIDPESGVKARGKFLGLTEEGTRLEGTPTGLDHLVDLGVNTVQLMPVTEFASSEAQDQYGWGYDSVHFNTPDGWFASSPHDGSRVRELKQTIDALHRKGLRVTLDMVYNHTMEDRFHNRIYSFEGLVPGYYYRRRPDGSYYNGSGVGNELRTEAPMVRRFLVDSTKMWVQEYGVDGFRFDLMGLIDVDTMTEIARAVHEIDPNVMVYGEPWVADETPITVTAKGTQRGRGFAVFNDDFRDALKGHVFQPYASGFVQTGEKTDEIRQGMLGATNPHNPRSFAASPLETINYVECHDNHTLWDRLLLSTDTSGARTPLASPGAASAPASEEQRVAMARLAAVAVLTAQGIPFLHSGQEFLRTKQGHENSYNQPDSVNQIEWRRKLEHADTVAYYQGLLQLRREHPMFRLPTAELVEDGVTFMLANEGLVVAALHDPDGQDRWSRALVCLNGRGEATEVNLPPGEWQLMVDGERAGTESLRPVRGTLHLPGHSAAVLALPKRP